MKEYEKKERKKGKKAGLNKDTFGRLAGYSAACFAAAVLLYDDWRYGFILLLGLPFYVRKIKGSKLRELRAEYLAQFKDALTSLGTALEAGYAMENAIAAANRDLQCIYPEDSWIRQELGRVSREIANAVPAAVALEHFAAESGIEDAQSFARLYATAQKSGGNLIELVRSAAAVIADKTEMEREIHTILTAKQLECRIMRLIPPGILLYFRLCSPGFLDVLYVGAGGKIMMTAVLLAYLFFAWQMERITRIKV